MPGGRNPPEGRYVQFKDFLSSSRIRPMIFLPLFSRLSSIYGYIGSLIVYMAPLPEMDMAIIVP